MKKIQHFSLILMLSLSTQLLFAQDNSRASPQINQNNLTQSTALPNSAGPERETGEEDIPGDEASILSLQSNDYPSPLTLTQHQSNYITTQISLLPKLPRSVKAYIISLDASKEQKTALAQLSGALYDIAQMPAIFYTPHIYDKNDVAILRAQQRKLLNSVACVQEYSTNYAEVLAYSKQIEAYIFNTPSDQRHYAQFSKNVARFQLKPVSCNLMSLQTQLDRDVFSHQMRWD